MRLAERVALVIGGGGIGRAICVRFAAEGAPVAVAGLAAYLAGDEGFPYTPLPFVL